VATVAISSAILLPAAAEAATISAPYNSISVDAGSRTTDGYALRTSMVFDSNDTFYEFIQPPGSEQLTLSGQRSDPGGQFHFLNVTLKPPTGQTWSVGTYPAFYADATHAEIDLGIDGLECDGGATSSLNVTEVLRDSGGALTGLAATYVSACVFGDPPLRGTIRWQSTQDFIGVNASTNRVVFGDQPMTIPGTPKVVTYTARGSLSSTFGTATLGGTNADAFAITGDTCSQATLSYGQTCTVTVTPTATALGAQTATLTIPDNSDVGFRFAGLELNGVDNRVVTVSPPGIDFPQGELGVASTPVPVTVTVTGPSPVTFGSAVFVGDFADSFGVASDGCANQTLAPAASCVVSVVADPVHDGGVAAELRIPDNSSLTYRRVSVSVTGIMPGRGTYFPVTPYRLLDTRSGLGAPKAAVGPGGVVHLQVTGRGPVPAQGVAAVVLNVTVTGPTAASYVSVYPTGGSRPTVSSLNFPRGWTGANSVTVAVGTGGKVDLYNLTGSTQLITDVVGYYVTDLPSGPRRIGGEYQAAVPSRMVDTRGGPKLPAGYFIQLPVNFGDTVNPHIRALAVNVTATGADKAGFFTTFDGNDSNFPTASTLNYTKNATVANFAIVPVSPCGICTGSGYLKPSIAVYTSATAHVIVDIFGFYDDTTLGDGMRFHPMSPVRITDSRTGLGTPHALGPAATATITAPDSVLDSATTALALNVTAVNPSVGTYLTVWPADAGLDRPGVSNINANAHAVVANAVTTEIGPANAFNVYNNGGTTDICVDVVGTFYFYPYKLAYNNYSAKPAGHTGAYALTAQQPAPQLRAR
jgi:hypothetical protein